MTPLRSLPLLALAASLALPGTAQAAKPLKVDAPAAGEVAVVVASVGKRAAKAKPKLKATGVPAGVSVLGGVTPSGRLAVAVVRPRDAAKGGKVSISLKARGKTVKAKGAKRVAGGGSACKDAKLGTALGRKVAGSVSKGDAKALGGALGRRACGKPASAADTALLDRLGLGAPPAGQPPAPPITIPPPATSGGTTAPIGPPSRPSQPSNPGNPGNPGGGTANQCSNGVDDDGDGQTDFGTNQNVSRPDPGCASSTDDEAGEVAVSAECAGSSGVSRGNEDRNSAFAAINSGCGDFTAYWINIAPGPIATCKSFTAESNFECAVEQGDAVARSMDGKPTDMADTLIGMAGSFDCSIPATIALVRADGSVAELVEPVGGCEGGDGPQKAVCDNGIDDDGDGQTDARETPGAGDPDPGCSSRTDGTENSETGLPAGCSIGAGTNPDNGRVISIAANGCGEVKGLSFTPPGTPEVCVYQIGSEPVQECSVVGATASAEFAATGQDVALGTRLSALPECGRLVTVAVEMADGSVAELRDTWCD